MQDIGDVFVMLLCFCVAAWAIFIVGDMIADFLSDERKRKNAAKLSPGSIAYTPKLSADEELSRYSKSIADDDINHPSHYTQGNIEVIDYIEDKKLGYRLGNVVKYVSRAGHKDDALKDLKKAQWYLNREIEKREQDDKSRAYTN